MYKFLDHISDLEVIVEADSFEKIIEESVKAVTSAVAKNIELKDQREIRVVGDFPTMLMGVLEEVVYFQSGEEFYVAEVKVVKEGGGLTVLLRGGPAEVIDEIKAVTWHELWVKEGPWTAHFICDL
ncbi:MAG: archease [Candidatus Altiarchaeota archaeon]|nr:archease [Candidatus Altiarchaeota archaeon]